MNRQSSGTRVNGITSMPKEWPWAGPGPVRAIAPFGRDGATDRVARLVAGALAQHWGQAIEVDNIPGRGGCAGTQAAAVGHHAVARNHAALAAHLALAGPPQKLGHAFVYPDHAAGRTGLTC